MTSRGMTLLELTVAMAIFALVAVMAASALTSSIGIERRLSASEMASVDLAYGLALLRRDLGQGAALSIVGRDRTVAPPLRLDGPTGPLSLTLADEPVLPGGAESGLARVTWAFDAASGTMTRAYRVLGSEDDPRPVAVLTGVTSVAIRALSDAEWQSQYGLPGPGTAQGATIPQILPTGIEIRMDTRLYGPLRVYEAL